MKNKLNIVKYSLVLIYFVGLIGLLNISTRNFFLPLTPWIILLTVAALMLFHKPLDIKHFSIMTFIALAGFFIEYYGILSGKIFGIYTYGETLGPKVLETPLIIGFNWLLLVYCVFITFDFLNIHFVLKSFLGAITMTIYDLNLEPVAIEFGYWRWFANAIPIQNYIGWFFISLILLSSLHNFKFKASNPIASFILVLLFIYFLILNILI